MLRSLSSNYQRSDKQRSYRQRQTIAFGLMVSLVVAGFGCRRDEQVQTVAPVAAEEAIGPIGLRVVKPDGSTRDYGALKIVAGDTLLDCLRRIPESGFSIRGDGAMAFVTEIDSFASRGGEGWTFYVNGQWADRGIGDFEVHPDDQIEWRYGDFSPEDSPTSD